MEELESGDARVIECLQDFRDELTTPECRDQVHLLTQRASQDIRMDEPLADACAEDRQKLCSDVQPVRVGGVKSLLHHVQLHMEHLHVG